MCVSVYVCSPGCNAGYVANVTRLLQTLYGLLLSQSVNFAIVSTFIGHTLINSRIRMHPPPQTTSMRVISVYVCA